MANPLQLEQKEKRPNFNKQYYTNKPLKHFSNQFLGQMEINTFSDIIVGLKGAGKSAFIGKIQNDHPHHWRIGRITISPDIDNITAILLEQFEIEDAEQLSNPDDINRHIINRFHQAISLGLKIFIFIDNAENLKSHHIEQLLVFHKIAKLIFFASPDFYHIVSKHQNTGLFFRGNLMALGLFTPEDTEKLIKRRLANIKFKGRFPFSKDEISDISIVSHGNPYLIKLLCNQFLKNKNQPIPELAKTKAIYDEIIDTINLGDYTNLNNINEAIKAHEIAREISGDINCDPRKRKNLRNRVIAVSATMILFMIMVTFIVLKDTPNIDLKDNPKPSSNVNLSQKKSSSSEKKQISAHPPITTQQDPSFPISSTSVQNNVESISKSTTELNDEPSNPIIIKNDFREDKQDSISDGQDIIPEVHPLKNEPTLLQEKTHPEIQLSNKPKDVDKSDINTEKAFDKLELKPDIIKTNKVSTKTVNIIPSPATEPKQEPISSAGALSLKQPSQKTKLLGYDWFEKQPEERYTIQMMGSTDYQKLIAEIKRYQFILPVSIIEMERSGKLPWYSAIYGSFESKKKAKSAIKTLPKKIKKNKPWPKKFKTIRDKF